MLPYGLSVSKAGPAKQLVQVNPPTAAPETRFEVRIRSGVNAAWQALAQVLCALEPLQLGTEDAAKVQLVLAEVLNNIVEHAYPEDTPDGLIYVECRHIADGLHFSIHDQGNPMPEGSTPVGQRPDVEVETEDLPEGGFGWFLIQALAKDVVYRRVGQENQLDLRIAVACQPAPEQGNQSAT